MSRRSFASEHTLEYLLIPKLRDLLSHWYKVVPIYPWKQYEGNTLGKSSFKNKSIKLFAFYPRRPKVAHPSSNEIELKINDLLNITGNILSEHQIPCVAGAPLISNLEELGESVSIIYFNIKGEEFGDTYFLINKKSVEIIEKRGNPSTHIVSEDLLIDIINDCSNMKWEEALKLMDEVKREVRSLNFNRLFGPRYKPVYFVLIPKH